MDLRPLCLFISSLALAACGTGTAVTVDATPPDAHLADASPSIDGSAMDAGACRTRWQLQNASSVPVAFSTAGGKLIYEASSFAVSSFEPHLFQDGLSGDFDIQVAFEGFTAGGDGGYAGVSLLQLGDSFSANAWLGNRPLVGIGVSVDRPPEISEAQLRPTAAAAGSFRLQRTGDQLEVSADTGDAQAQVAHAWNGEPLRLAIVLGNSNPAADLQSPLRIEIDYVRVTGGGGDVLSDEFDCDTLP